MLLMKYAELYIFKLMKFQGSIPLSSSIYCVNKHGEELSLVHTLCKYNNYIVFCL